MSGVIGERLEAVLWDPGRTTLAGPGRWLLRTLRFVYALARDVLSGQLTLRATGLVYVTILSIVPVIAISFSVLKAFGVHRQLEPLLYQLLLPLGEQGAELTNRVIGFVENVQGNLLAGVGLALLFVTTMSMAQRVEDSFNFVWRVEHPRGLGRRVSQYLTVILVGPVVMVTAITLIAMLESSAVVQRLAEVAPIGETITLVGKAAPYLLVCAAFTFIYWFVPNTHVRFLPAIAGGLVGGLLWAASGVVFARFVAVSVQTVNIYATFAIVIFALIWLYLCWLILLIGAQVSFYAQHPAYLRLGHRPLMLSSRLRDETALTVMYLTTRAFREGGPPVTPAGLEEDTGLPAMVTGPVMHKLEAAGLLARTDRDELLPQRDPEQIPVREIIAAVREPLHRDYVPARHLPAAVQSASDRIDQALTDHLGDLTLADLVAQDSSADS